MFVNSVEVISNGLGNITLQNNMQPKADRPPVCPKTQLPLLHLTPSNPGTKTDNQSKADEPSSPGLLKPRHEMPSTPPPQRHEYEQRFFQKMG